MISGVKTIPMEWKVDDRGYLLQLFQSTDKLFPGAKRVYVVGNFNKGTIRGFHKHEIEQKYFVVIQGSVRFVLAKTNKDNKLEEMQTIVISAKEPKVLVVPAGLYNGWQSLEENTLLIGISDKTLEESLADDYRLDPFAFGKDVWEVKAR